MKIFCRAELEWRQPLSSASQSVVCPPSEGGDTQVLAKDIDGVAAVKGEKVVTLPVLL